MERRAVVLAVVVAAVVALTYGLSLLGLDDDPARAEPGPSGEATSTTATPDRPRGDRVREPTLLSEFHDGPAGPCDGLGFSGGAPPVRDLDRQLDISREVLAVGDERFRVVLAGPTHLGVVAVVRGDQDVARRELDGVSHVVRMTLGYSDLGPDRTFQMYAAVFDLLRPAVRAVGRQVRALGGGPEVYGWAEAGAVVISVARPVPPAVRALAGRRPDGVRVVLEPTRYSRAEIAAAQRELPRHLRALGVADSWMAGACGDNSALEVTLPTAEPARLGRRLTRLLGLRVRVVDGYVSMS